MYNGVFGVVILAQKKSHSYPDNRTSSTFEQMGYLLRFSVRSIASVRCAMKTPRVRPSIRSCHQQTCMDPLVNGTEVASIELRNHVKQWVLNCV